jgi:glycosyltransferase involved in cell wall biosynthesis
MATVGRKDEVKSFLQCLENQSYKNFELIIVDQNDNDLIDHLVNEYKTKLPIKHIKIVQKGLSLARNAGIKEACGDIISFPDDDCLYPHDLLKKIYEFFCGRPNVDAISTAWHDSLNGKPIRNYGEKEDTIDKITVWTKVSSITLFLKREILNNIGGFDEELGIGPTSIWQGAEDKDLPLRLLKTNFTLIFTPFIYVLHPSPDYKAESFLSGKKRKQYLNKVYNYSAAAGYVMSKHQYPLYLKAGAVMVIFIKLIVALIKLDFFMVKVRFFSLTGRMDGFFNRLVEKQ